MTTRSRFAPSPTGLLHVGGARTALFVYLFARSADGKFVLRIEDTDRARSSQASEDAIFADLQWLGLEWDEGPQEGGPGAPYRQSERLAYYDECVQALLDSGKAYLAWETPDELARMREQDGAGFKYRKYEYDAEDMVEFEAEGRRPVVRFAVPLEKGKIGFHDEILGDVEVDIDEVDDFVIRKADGFPTYHFAVVVDDVHMQITHVLRAQEHFKNTLKHRLLYEALGWEEHFPKHGHMPIINRIEGGKMSKRDKARAARAAARAAGLDAAGLAEKTGLDVVTSQAFLKKKNDEVAIAVRVAEALEIELPEIDCIDFRRAGFLPEAIVNFLALLGWNPGLRDDEGNEVEILPLSEMAKHFSLDRVGKTAARFDREKLRWMNGQYIRLVSPERRAEALQDWIDHNPGSVLEEWDADRRAWLVELYKDRLTAFADLARDAEFFFVRPTEWGPAKAIKKHLLKGGGLDRLRAAQAVLAAADWNEEALEAALTAAAEADYDGKLGKLAQPVRVAVAGGPVSPPIFGTLVGIGREESLARIEACLAHHAE
ncbi:MAG: glutamate--tRNA ligase [Proteobacteria bacterium]|nr:glutamate--tRNA ligase [Pseudomonadota bacterium]MCP4916449.1 glutamate--tRNA ligase [Pseudomonadota bacterium]